MPDATKDYFISYSWQDKDIVRPLAEKLVSNDFSVWIDDRQVDLDGHIPKQVRLGLENCHTILLMWSQEASISWWVEDEWRSALHDKKRIVVCTLDRTDIIGELLGNPLVDLQTGGKALEELLTIVSTLVPNSTDEEGSHLCLDGDRCIHNLPFRDNAYFVGREDELRHIQAALTQTKSTTGAQSVIIFGLGGVGKTQLAARYAQLHARDYDVIWWLRAEGQITLSISYAALAQPLDLPQKNDPEQGVVIRAVKRWLQEHNRWLLIFDNAQNPKIVRTYLASNRTGHILITSRNPGWRTDSSPLSLGVWDRDVSVKFLLARTQEKDQDAAHQLAEILGDLPLALEQAGAYIEASAGTFESYLSLYEKQRKVLLTDKQQFSEYPETVATAWSVSINRVRKVAPTAVDVLNLCSFLAPSNIPNSLFSFDQANVPSLPQLSTDFGFPDSVAALKAYSLIDAGHDTLSVHRLVQAVTRDSLVVQNKNTFAAMAAQMVADAFPAGESENDPSDVRSWSRSEKLLPHALVVTKHAEKARLALEHVALLSNHAGAYLKSRGDYAAAEPLYQRALAIWQKHVGKDHPQVALFLNNLADLFSTQGKYTEAEPLYQHALAISEKAHGEDHPLVVGGLNNLAELLTKQGKYDASESLLWRAIDIGERALGADHPYVASALNNLANLLQIQGNYDDAEQLYQCAIEIRNKKLGPDHPDVASALNNLASLLKTQGKYTEAEPLYQRALAISEKALGPDHPDVTSALNNLASLLQTQGKYTEAEPLLQRVIEIRNEKLGPDHPRMASALNNLAGLLYSQGKLDDAEPLLRRVLAIDEKTLGPGHSDVAKSLNNLASVLNAQGNFDDAEPLLRRAHGISEKQLGKDHPQVAGVLNNLANLLQIQGNYTAAEPLYKRVLEIRTRTLGPDHPDVADALNNLAGLFYNQGKLDAAEPFFRRALEIFEKALGPDHPGTQTIRANHELLLHAMEQNK